jgi:hypothetical protein
MVQNMGFVQDEKSVSIFDDHEDEITKSTLWTFGFGGSYVHVTLLHNWYFPYHDIIITWTKEKTQRGLLAWDIPWIVDGHFPLHNGTLTKWFKLQWLDGVM